MPDYDALKTKQAEYHDWLNKKVEAARAAIREGRVYTSEEVEPYFAQRRADSLRKANLPGK